MVKKTTSFRLEPSDLKRLKILSAQMEKPIGDIIAGLLDLAEVSPAPLVETCLINAGTDSGNIVPEGVNPLAHALSVEDAAARDKKAEMILEQKQLRGKE